MMIELIQTPKLLIEDKCAQCGKEVEHVSIIFVVPGKYCKTLCRDCLANMDNDATVGQYMRINEKEKYDRLLAVKPGELLYNGVRG